MYSTMLLLLPVCESSDEGEASRSAQTTRKKPRNANHVFRSLGQYVTVLSQNASPCFATPRMFPTMSLRIPTLILDTNNEPEAGFRAVVQRLESCLTSDDQVYLLGTKGPSAADFTLYGMMIRMVDEAFDAHVDPCCPRLFEEYAAPRLREWYRRMKAQFPLQFFNRDKLQRR